MIIHRSRFGFSAFVAFRMDEWVGSLVFVSSSGKTWRAVCLLTSFDGPKRQLFPIVPSSRFSVARHGCLYVPDLVDVAWPTLIDLR